MDTRLCLQLIVALAGIVGIWLRMEKRMTRIEDRVRERYRDKAAVNERFGEIERWLPKRDE